MAGLSKRTMAVIGASVGVLAIYLMGSDRQPQDAAETVADQSQ